MLTHVNWILLLLSVVGGAWQVSRADQVWQPIRREAVATAVREAIAATDAKEVQFKDEDIVFATVPARSEAPVLRVVSLSNNASANSIDARLECENRECLPFYVSLQFHDVGAVDRLLHSKPVRVGSPSGARKTAVMRAGSKAEYTIAVGGVRLILLTTCLQSGAIGDVVRVRVNKTGRTLLGRIEGPTTLRAVGAVR